MTDIDDEVKAAADRAAMAWLGEQLESATETDEKGRVRQDWAQRRAAAQVICEREGLLDVLRSLSADGALRPPPAWPATDIVPVGGGPGFLDVEVRTLHQQRGIVAVPLRMNIPADTVRGPERSAKIRSAIGEAHERGVWQLRKMLSGRVRR